MKGFTVDRKIIGNPSVSLSLTLSKNEKVEHQTHKFIGLRF